MDLFFTIIIFILGSAIGSFLSVIIYRVKHKKKGIFFSRSLCPGCKKKIKWHHLMPILSWIFLKGKCAYCGKRISSHYMLLELVTGLAFLVAYLNWPFIESATSTIDSSLIAYSINSEALSKFTFYAIEFSLLIAIFFYDLLYKIIPDRFSLAAIGIGIGGGLVFGTPTLIDMALGGGVIFTFFAAQYFISKGTWIGGGDLRLGVLMGVLLGLEKGLLALVIAYFIGAAIGVLLLLQKKATRKTEIAFGPFLITGIIIALFWGEYILKTYLNGFYG